MTGSTLPLRRKVGYGVGDFGFNLFFTTAGLFLLFYYTDVLGLSPATAGWVFAVALIWDALFDPVMGYVANRTRTRWGRYRPYLLFGAIPLSASWMLIFLPTGLTGTALLLFALAAHVLFRTLYAVVSMPYLALTAVITSDSAERGAVAGVRMAFAATCGLFAAFSTLKLVELFGGGQRGFLWTAVLFGCLAAVIFGIVFVSTDEGAVSETLAPEPRVSDMLRMLRSNTAFWLVAAAMLAASFAGTMFSKTLPYWFKYQLGRPDLIGPALTVLTAAVTVSIPLWTTVMRRTSKRTMWLCGLAVSFMAYPALWIAPERSDVWMPLLALAGLGSGASYIGFWAAIPDTVEYGDWRSGVRSEGAIFGIVSLVQKAGLGLAAAALGELLSLAGYRANTAQTPETLASMKLILLGMPLLFNTLTLTAVFLYPLDHRLHGRLRRALSRRDARSSRDIDGSKFSEDGDAAQFEARRA